jgi:hypothetical protein
MNSCVKLNGRFRDFITDKDKIRLYERYTAGEVDEEVVRFLLGDELDAMREDAVDFDATRELDADSMFQDE